MRNAVQPRGAAAPPGAQTRGADAGRTAGLVGPAFSATLARAAGFSPPPHSAPSIFSSLCSRSPGHEPIAALSWSRNEHPSWLPIDFSPGDTGAICLCQRPLRTGARGPRCASWLTSSRRERRHRPALKSGTPRPRNGSGTELRVCGARHNPSRPPRQSWRRPSLSVGHAEPQLQSPRPAEPAPVIQAHAVRSASLSLGLESGTSALAGVVSRRPWSGTFSGS